ncbi:MAG: sigma-70 family RNA polymerase sigma factor [Candidatus Geothermincolia bacterium]
MDRKGVGVNWDPVEVASRARGYDPEAFAALFDAFYEKIRRFAYFHTGDEHLADDLAAEVFSQALESIDKFTDRGGTIGPWLYGIAKNVIASHFRSSTSKSTLPLDEAVPAPSADCPEDRALRNLSHEGLYQALCILTDDQKAIVVLRFIEGYDVKTVARALGKKPGAVRTQQHRAIAALRTHFESMEEKP